MSMDQERKAEKLDELAAILRAVDDTTVYGAIGDPDTPEKAREELYGLIEDLDDLSDRLNRAAEIMREEVTTT